MCVLALLQLPENVLGNPFGGEGRVIQFSISRHLLTLGLDPATRTTFMGRRLLNVCVCVRVCVCVCMCVYVCVCMCVCVYGQLVT